MTRSEQSLSLNQLPHLAASQSLSGSSTGNTSPIEPNTTSSRSPFGLPNGVSSINRIGAGSPSHDMTGRPFSKRAREIQAQEGLTTPSLWGPPASGGSTPLRETIPESPSQDGFPDFVPPGDAPAATTLPRRARAGTVPSRLSPGNGLTGLTLSSTLVPKTARPTPSTSPFRPLSANAEISASGATDSRLSTSPTTSTLLSRLRAGSMPQRASSAGLTSAFGPAVFSPWASTPSVGRGRASTLASIRSADERDSTAASSVSRDTLADADVRTLDYLGLADVPQQHRAGLVTGNPTLAATNSASAAMLQPFLADLASFNRNLSRYRSYSVNATENYVEDEDDELAGVGTLSGLPSGTITPSAASTAAALAATQAQIHQHNLAVQAFASQASANRPRARTAGVLDTPLRSSTRGFLAPPSRLDASYSASDLSVSDDGDLHGLSDAIGALRFPSATATVTTDMSEESSLEGPSRALWIGNIPASTTVSSLQAIFSPFGPIESTRVLIPKNCGFVNFETIDSAVRARSILHGKEIFPGAGSVRIGFAKAPIAGSANTPSSAGPLYSPSPDLQKPEPDTLAQGGPQMATEVPTARDESNAGTNAALDASIPDLRAAREQVLDMVRQFGSTDQEMVAVESMLQASIDFQDYRPEIPCIAEPSHARVHDAPKLREIRKRIDNNAISAEELEDIAMAMLPEIAELSADYLGNTVVQKLFEFCSEPTKEVMLERIAPHLAEIGVHKNGTWAAQKIIDVANTPSQIALIVDNLRPYTVSLFLDQYGNYVLQCCLRFGFPYNGFIFETMASRLWDIAQGRFGARAMRACLESHHATKSQQRILAAMIAVNCVRLATNPNGALLLTWYLDTCTFPRRRTALAPRLVPQLLHLCTHKVAYLTVLKVINQRNEPQGRDAILQALFFSPNDALLESILSDQACGATLVFKILTTPFLDDYMRTDVVPHVQAVLNRLKVASIPGYKRLLDEVGLSPRNSHGRADRDGNSGQTHFQDRGRTMANHAQRNVSGPAASPFHALSPQFAAGVESAPLFDAFNVSSPLFTPTSAGGQPLQYATPMLNANRSASQTTMYSGYPTPTGSFDTYRNGVGSPLGQPPSAMSPGQMMPGAPFAAAPPGFPMMNGYAGYPQVPFYGQPPVQPMAGGRRGRR